MTPISHTSLADEQQILWDFTLPNTPTQQMNASEWHFPPLTLHPAKSPSSSSSSSSSPSSIEAGEGVAAAPCRSHPDSSRTALHLAVCSGNEAITRLLLSQGADPQRHDSHGQTALHLAVERGHARIVDILLQQSPTTTAAAAATANSCGTRAVDVRDSMGRTALFPAVRARNHALARRLLEAEIDVDCKDEAGAVALHWAVEMGGQEGEALVRLLLEFGADVDA
jgi:ankyrin repeat protein